MNQHVINGKELNLRCVGKVSATEVKYLLGQYHGDPRMDAVSDVIADFIGCDAKSQAPQILEEITGFVKVASSTNPCLRFAVITDSPEILQAAETCAAFDSIHFPIQVFTFIDAARKWFAQTPLRSKHASMLEY